MFKTLSSFLTHFILAIIFFGQKNSQNRPSFWLKFLIGLLEGGGFKVTVECSFPNALPRPVARQVPIQC